MINREDLEGYDCPPELLEKFLSECAVIKLGTHKLWPRVNWCITRFGTPYQKSLNLLHDLMFGRINNFQGITWGHCVNIFDIDEYLFWFDDPANRMEFALTWS